MSGLGPLVRLRPLATKQLPAHPDLASAQATNDCPNLESFISDVLREASTFMTSYLPENASVKSESKKSPPAQADVKVLVCNIARPPGGSDNAETWFARTSLHHNKREQGTADWEEFESGLLDDHSQHEKDYTPDVYDAHEVLTWSNSIVDSIEGWDKVNMSSELVFLSPIDVG